MRNCLALLSVLFLLAPGFCAAQAVNNCNDCVERKKSMCSQECVLVPPDKSIECQSACVFQYCRHRCTPDDPALAALKQPDCAGCQDQQFNLCEAACPSGTDRVRALCKLECAKNRCVTKCNQ